MASVTIKGKIVKAESRRNSVAGNPRWFVTLNNGTRYPTMADSACNYDVANFASPAFKNTTFSFQIENGAIATISKVA